MQEHLMKLQNSLASLQTRASDSGLAFWGEGGRRRGGMMTALLCRHPEQHLQKSRFTWFFQYFRDSHQLYSGLCELDIGLCEGFRRKLEIGWGEACSFTRYLKYFGHVVVHC